MDAGCAGAVPLSSVCSIGSTLRFSMAVVGSTFLALGISTICSLAEPGALHTLLGSALHPPDLTALSSFCTRPLRSKPVSLDHTLLRRGFPCMHKELCTPPLAGQTGMSMRCAAPLWQHHIAWKRLPRSSSAGLRNQLSILMWQICPALVQGQGACVMQKSP